MDVRETRFSLMPVHPQPRDHWDWIVPTPSSLNAWRVLVKRAKGELITRDLLGIILCVPGIVDEAAGNVLFSPNLHWTEGVSLPASFHDVWHLPVVVVQELRSLALGHKTLDTSGEDFLAVDIGEGVGAAAVVGGMPYATQLPMSGELGHTQVQGSRRTCGCGAVGCLETMISRRGLLESFSESFAQREVDLAGLARHIDAQGVPPWLADTLHGAGTVIAGAINVMGIRKVVITGLLNDLPECVHARLAESISGGSLWERFGKISCVFAPRHHTAGMVAVGLDRVVMPHDPGMPQAHLPGTAGSMTG
jgi:predicted NBD/HSP70 family sugar kinase